MLNKNSWVSQLNAFPYAQPLMIGWQISDHSKDAYWSEYEQALNTYLSSLDEQNALGERYQNLLKSLKLFQALAEKGDAHLGTSLALIRINFELGNSQEATHAMDKLLQIMPWFSDPIPDELQISINRPFLPPISSFDHRHVNDNLAQWIQAALQEVLMLLDSN